MLNTEHRRDDVHVLFDDIRSGHGHVNNKIKRKFTLLQ